MVRLISSAGSLPLPGAASFGFKMASSLGLVKLLLAPPARSAGAPAARCAEVEAWLLLIEGDSASCPVPESMAALFEL